MDTEWKPVPYADWEWYDAVGAVKCPCGETVIVDAQDGMDDCHCSCGRKYVASFDIKICEPGPDNSA